MLDFVVPPAYHHPNVSLREVGQDFLKPTFIANFHMTLRRTFSFAALLAVICCPGLAFGQVFIVDSFDTNPVTLTRGTVPGVGSNPTNQSSVAAVDSILFDQTRRLEITGFSGTSNTIAVNGGALSYTTLSSNLRAGNISWTTNAPIDFLNDIDAFGFRLTILNSTGLTNVALTVISSSSDSTVLFPNATAGNWEPLFTDFNPLVLADVVGIRLDFLSQNGGSITMDSFEIVPEASPLMMLIGAIAVVGGGRYGWKRYKTRRELAA